MADLALALEVEEIRRHARIADRADRKRRNEGLRSLGHHTPDGDPSLAEAADEVEAFVGGDAAADDQENALHGISRLEPRLVTDFNAAGMDPGVRGPAGAAIVASP